MTQTLLTIRPTRAGCLAPLTAAVAAVLPLPGNDFPAADVVVLRVGVVSVCIVLFS